MAKLLWEAIHRSTTGPIMSEEEFETELFPSVLADLQAKYRLEWDPDEPSMIDPDMADAVFQVEHHGPGARGQLGPVVVETVEVGAAELREGGTWADGRACSPAAADR